MIIAIPSVTNYINDSRKSAYVDTAKEIVSGTRNLVNEGKLGMYDTSATYYIPVDYINTENALKSAHSCFHTHCMPKQHFNSKSQLLKHPNMGLYSCDLI